MRKLRVGQINEFKNEGIYRISPEGYDLILINHAENLYCLENRCSHEDFPLEDGELEEHNGQICVTCPAHGAKFSLDGKVLTLPANENIKRFRVLVQDNEVFIEV